MYPLNDKDLDRLSRDAAEHYDVESSASGWERLESRLDKELPEKKDRRRFLFWLFFIVLLTGGSLAYLLDRSPVESKLASGKPEAGNVSKVSAAEVRDAEKKATETVNNNQKQNNDQPVAANAVANKDAADIPEARKQTVRNQTRQLTTNDNNRSRKPVKNSIQTGPAGNNQQTTAPTTFVELMKGKMPEIDKTKMYEDGIVKKDIPAPPAEAAKKPEVKKSEKPGKWEFGILTGPDFNNVGFKYSARTGLNIGATVGYRISNRLQVNTGLIYTKKWYKVAGEDFTPPKHSWLSYQDISMVNGNCNMFEIPVNLRYDFSYNQKRRIFASTGISSYIMDKQYYEADYSDSPGGTTYVYKRGTDSNYNHFMSNLNFSIGYERAIGKQFSIQAEPYFKLPLKGLGYGSIDMNSYGMYITFKYKPLGRTKK